MEKEWILIRYGEIALKSDPVRKKFEHRLMDNIRAGFAEEGIEGEVKRGYGRIFVKTEDVDKASEVLSRIFGIVSFSPSIKLETDFEKIVDRASKVGDKIIDSGNTFAVRARRTGDHEFTSKEVEEKVGAEIIDKTRAEVDLDDPDKTVYVEVRQGQTYIFREKIEGPGGMPLGTQGKIISLFRGDCRSFLATWLLMKRGCSPIILHADMSPYTTEKNTSKAVEELKKWSYGAEMEVLNFNFGDELFKIDENAGKNLTCILCRRFLLRFASQIASESDAKALVTGETSRESFLNFKLEDSVTKFPVLRPLVGFTNEEVRDRCKDIGADFLLKKGKCKAKSNLAPEVEEEGLKKAEENLNLDDILEEKMKEVRPDENS